MTAAPRVLPRSFLYVPANRPDLYDKAASGPADAIVLDLEDAVPLPDKDAARRSLVEWLDARAAEPVDGPEVWVRVSDEFLGDDLDAAVRRGVRGLLLAKCSYDQLEAASNALVVLEAQRDVDVPLDLVGLVETASAVRELGRITSHHRLTTLGIGEVDLLGDLRMTRSPRTTAAIDAIRTQVVVQCAASGRAAPVAPTSTDFRDLEAFEESTRHLLDLGFRSRTAVHPSQIDAIHTVATPSEESLAQAQAVLDLFDRADGGVTVDDRGRLVDAAVVREARETLGRRRG